MLRVPSPDHPTTPTAEPKKIVCKNIHGGEERMALGALVNILSGENEHAQSVQHLERAKKL